MLSGKHPDPGPVGTGPEGFGFRNQASHIVSVKPRESLQRPASLACWSTPVAHCLHGGRDLDNRDRDNDAADHSAQKVELVQKGRDGDQ
jgi:hypothetical protein